MRSLFMNCQGCDGDGYVTIDLNDTHIPYEQNPVDYTCIYCDGKGLQLDKDEVEDRIGIIDDMIEGMQTRMRLHSDFIIQLRKGYLNELAEKYVYRLDTCSRGLGRLLNYKRKLHNLAQN
jgi:hypothetical protein